MKKTHPEDIVYQGIVIRKHEKRRLRKRRNKVKTFVRSKKNTITAPSILCLYSKNKIYNSTILFIKKFAKEVVQNKKKVTIDLSNVNVFTAAAALCIYAEICRCKLLRNDKGCIKLIKPTNAEIKEKLTKYGFFSYSCLYADEDKEISTEDNVIPCMSGEHGDKYIDTVLDLINEAAFSGDIPEFTEQTLFRSLSEAMLNVWHHAYDGDFVDKDEVEKIGKRWWIMGERIDNQLYIVIYDRGAGVPVTLPKKYKKEMILSVLQKISIMDMNDSNMILAAMELGRTRTGKSERGKGLQDVRRFVEINPSGTLRIYSNKGEYLYRNKSKEEITKNHGLSIKGTLIQWNVKIH